MSRGAAPLYTTKLDGEIPPRMLESYPPGTQGGEPGRTMMEALKTAVDTYGPRNALAVKRVPPGGSVKDTPWRYYTWNEYSQDARRFGKAVLTLGLKPHQCVNILGFNSPEWYMSYLGSNMAGGVAVGIYTTNGPEACKYVTAHSKAVVVVLEDEAQLHKYQECIKKKDDCPDLKAIVQWTGSVPAGLTLQDRKDVRVYSWEEFLTLGGGGEEGSSKWDKELDKRTKDTRPGHCCALIYTSGTTGPPKGVMLSHDNLTWVGKNAEAYFPDRRPTDCLVSYLPLSHVAAQVIDVVLPMGCGGCIYFAQPDALKGSLIHTLLEVRPNFFFGVPRVWEKMYERMQAVRANTPLPLRLLSDYLKAITLRWAKSTQYGNTEQRHCMQGVAESLFGKIKEKLGLDMARYCATGAAPMPREVQEYFASLGMIIYEVFGQSEGTGTQTLNCPHAWKLGTVGRPPPGLELRFAEDTSEFQYRGRAVFMGYLGMEEETKATVVEGGWVRSGDVAVVDADHDPEVAKPSGFVRITGRIKEIIVTAGGENIPPVLIETELKAAMPALASCMVVGDKRKYLVALLTLHSDEEGRLMESSLEAGAAMGSKATTVQEVKQDPLWKAYVEEGRKAANKKATSRAQEVQKVAFLPVDFSEKAGDLTPTLKLKRSVVAEKYKDVIESLYH